MREIKFRYRLESYADSTVKPFFVYITLEELEEIAEFKGLLDKFTEHDWGEDYNTYHILSRDQFTGLKDKNGKEIYERDIVQYHYEERITQTKIESKYIVVFSHGSFEQEILEINKSDIWYDWNELEIIGNTHENPELLKED